MNYFIRYWLPVIAYCAFIYVQSSYPSPDRLPSFAYSDKLLHFLAYAVLAAMICRAFNTIERWHHNWGCLFAFGVIAATLYGLSDEWHQSFVSQRTAEFLDVLADFIGSLAGSWVYIARLRSRSAASPV